MCLISRQLASDTEVSGYLVGCPAFKAASGPLSYLQIAAKSQVAAFS